MEVPYINASAEMQRKINALEEENTRLRNAVMSSNEEIFTLKAVSVTIEAELKYNTELELAKMGSELKFRSKELEKLSRDHERVLKELSNLKQQESSNKKLSNSDTVLNKGRRESSVLSGKSQQDEDKSTVLESERQQQLPSPTVSKSQVIPHGDSGVKTEISATTLPQTSSSNDKTALRTFSSRCQPTAMNNNSQLLEISTTFQAFLTKALIDNALCLSSSSIDRLAKAGHLLSSIQLEFRPSWIFSVMCEYFDLVVGVAVEISSVFDTKHDLSRAFQSAICILLCTLNLTLSLLRDYIVTATNYEIKASGTAAVVGSLQGKFDQAATITHSVSAMKGNSSAHTINAQQSRHLGQHGVVILKALHIPALSAEAQAGLLQNSHSRTFSCDYITALPDNSKIKSLIASYCNVVGKVVGYCCKRMGVAFSDNISGCVDLMAYSAMACDIMIKLRESSIKNIEENDNSSADVAETQNSLAHFGMNLVEHAGKYWMMHNEDAMVSSSELLQLWGTIAIAPARMRNIKSSSSQQFIYETLGDMIGVVSAPLHHVGSENIVFRCEVVQVLSKVLEAKGGVFVREGLLGLAGKETMAKNNACPSNNTSSSSKKRGAEEMIQSTITPTHSRKAHRGRGDSTTGEVGGSGGGGASLQEHTAVRITPSGSGSAPRSGGRSRMCPVGGVIDIADSVALIRRDHINNLAQGWIRLIRFLDDTDPVSDCRHPSVLESAVVRLVHLLGNFLSAVTDHLPPQDCELVLSECADVLHEFIYRCNTSSWSPLLRMNDALFGFLESRQNEST